MLLLPRFVCYKQKKEKKMKEEMCLFANFRFNSRKGFKDVSKRFLGLEGMENIIIIIIIIELLFVLVVLGCCCSMWKRDLLFIRFGLTVFFIFFIFSLLLLLLLFLLKDFRFEEKNKRKIFYGWLRFRFFLFFNFAKVLIIMIIKNH